MISGIQTYIKDVEFKTADDFLKAISYGGDLYKVLDHKFIFRGHFSDKYQLLPYLLRRGAADTYLPQESILGKYHPMFCELDKPLITIEYDILREFFDIVDRNGLYLPNVERLRSTVTLPLDSKFYAAKEEWLPEELWEIAALAQHYGLPTRLLDWSSDLYVALYFATQQALYGTSKTEKGLLKDGVKLIEREFLKIREGKSEKDDAKSELEKCRIEIWAMDYKSLLAKSYTDELKGFRLRIIRPSYSSNPNLAAQLGLFTLWQIEKCPLFPINENLNFSDRTPLDKLITDCLERNKVEMAEPIFYRITLPRSESSSILDFLFRKGYDAAKLFPGYGGACKAVEERGRLLGLKDLSAAL